MLESMFSFQGRLNRLQYFLRVLLLTAIIVVPGIFLAFQVALDGLGKSLSSFGLWGLLILIMIPALLWLSFAFQARRFRDIGLNPLYTILGWIGVMIVDAFLARAVPSLSLSHFVHQTILGLAINFGLGGALLFWPGKPNGGGMSSLNPFGDSPNESTPSHHVSVKYETSPRAAFGRRGL